MAGNSLPRGERERIVTHLKENPVALIRTVARRFQRSEELIRSIASEEGLTRKGKSGPAPGMKFEVYKPSDHGYLETDERQSVERRMMFEDETDIPISDSRRVSWQ